MFTKTNFRRILSDDIDSKRVNPFRPLKNWHLKKTKSATLNGCISKARANLESKLTFSESLFNFLQKRVVFCTLYPRGYTAGAPAARRGQRVKRVEVIRGRCLFN